MKILNSIQNETDYRQALDTVYALMQGQIREGSAEEDQLLHLTRLIEIYEAAHHSIGEQTDLIEAIKFRMEQTGLKHKDDEGDFYQELTDKQRASVQRGLAQIKFGDTVSHDEVRKLYQQWL